MTDVAIAVKDLTRRFGDFTAVDRISFEVKAGETVIGKAQDLHPIYPPEVPNHVLVVMTDPKGNLIDPSGKILDDRAPKSVPTAEAPEPVTAAKPAETMTKPADTTAKPADSTAKP